MLRVLVIFRDTALTAPREMDFILGGEPMADRNRSSSRPIGLGMKDSFSAAIGHLVLGGLCVREVSWNLEAVVELRRWKAGWP